jgi:hypothetical protein
VRKVAVMRLGASIESEYNFGSVFHMAARIAYEANLPLNLPYRTDDGFQVFHPGKDSFVASLGVGLHF